MKLLSRQNIAFRGSDEAASCNADDIRGNPGHCNAILAYRMDGGDEVLIAQQTKLSASKTLPNDSNVIQNQIIQLCAEDVRSEVQTAEVYAVAFDETTDAGNTEQLSVCLRAVNSADEVKEHFLGFFDTPRQLFGGDKPAKEPRETGLLLGNLVIDILQKMTCVWSPAPVSARIPAER